MLFRSGQINDALQKFIERYDFVLFDCEFDLKYLNQLVDVDIDLALVVTNPTAESIKLAGRINEYSAKYAAGGQLGVILNKAANDDLTEIYSLANESDIEIIGSIPFNTDSNAIADAVKHFYFRLNLPQENE